MSKKIRRGYAIAGDTDTNDLVGPIPPPENQRARMTRWFSPTELLRIVADVVVSTLIGKYISTRLIEALKEPKAPSHDYSKGDIDLNEFWFDYVADTGDGWNSTYDIARTIARPVLDIHLSDTDKFHSTIRGKILIFGGDEIYPSPSQSGYQFKLENVYRTALNGDTNPPDVFAIPGNHDWYDGLAAFSRLFVAGRKLGPCQTKQKRSYFALKLPKNWWLIATDIQLGSDIDAAQLQYFKEIAAGFDEFAQVILCVSEPHWVYASLNEDRDDESNLVVLEQKVLKNRVMVFISGDQHHYSRHQGPNNIQKIICGGGGAFLHATHRPKKLSKLNGGFERMACYPKASESSKLALRNFLFPFINPEFSIVPGIIYTMTVIMSQHDFSNYKFNQISMLYLDSAAKLLIEPIWLVWVFLLFSSFIIFSDRNGMVFRIAGGITHAFIHICTALTIGWLSFYLMQTPTPINIDNPLNNLLALTLNFILSAIIGSILFGSYLYISLTFFGKQVEAAFSGLRIQDWKSFLRFNIDNKGSLHIYAIGIDRVCRKWKIIREGNISMLVPDSKDSKATKPHLIERITIKPLKDSHRLKMCNVESISTNFDQ